MGVGIAVALALAWSPFAAAATIIHVPGDQPTIQAGIDAAAQGAVPGRRLRLHGAGDGDVAGGGVPELPVWGRPRGDAWLMRQVKQALDPRRLFNPGRFVGGI